MNTIVRLPNWIGDTLLALPALGGLGDLPGTGPVLAGRPAALSLARAALPRLPWLSLARSGDVRGWVADVAAGRRMRIERGVLLTPSLSSALWLWASGARERIGWTGQGRRAFVNRPRPRCARGRMHLTEEFKQLARCAGATRCPTLPALPAQPGERDAACSWLRERIGWRSGEPLAALIPGTHYGPAKRWPADAYATLARDLSARDIPGVVVGSPEEAASAASVAASGGARWASAAGVGSILFAAEVLRQAGVVVGNDSGGVHLAAAVGAPVVVLFGSTDPRWTAPRGAGHLIVRGGCARAPCYRPACPEDETVPCMTAIEPSTVLERAQFVLAHPVARREGAEGRPMQMRVGLRRALFLDRDGTLLEHVAYLDNPAGVKLVHGVGAALAAARRAGFLVVVVSNQAGIARGLFGEEAMEAVHAAIGKQLGRSEAAIDRFYFCPHHPDFTGPCSCRKPEPGMLLEAAHELGIDLGASFMIGDTVEDLQAGAEAGCQPILVRTGYGAAHAESRRSELPAGSGQAADLAAAIAEILADQP
jgi:D-glycero-D-manno-heptose 1,7-bisphosphate phosphatase